MRLLKLTLSLALSLCAVPAVAAERVVSIDGGAGKSLAGSLLTPSSPASGAAVLIIAGSGPTDRDGNSTVPGVQPNNLKLLAEGLADQGIASLRFDKRIVGASAAAAPAEKDMRFGMLVDDAVSWAQFLGKQDGVACVVLVGHSEGALIASQAAQKTPVCGVISIAGAGRPLDVVLREQLKALPPATMAQVEFILAGLKRGETFPGVPATDPLFRPSVQPYLISQLNLDPPAELAKVKSPVLILQGDADIQVTVEDARLLAAGRPDAKLEILSGVSHILKPGSADRAANSASYADPATPLDPRVVAAVAAFVKSAKPAP